MLSCALALTLNLVDPDLWGHVRYGQDWIASGKLPRTATHTYTAPGYRWINHENLAEITLATGYNYLGANGLLIAKCAWGMFILALMAWVASRHGVKPLVTWAFLLLVANGLTAFFPLRPQLLSFMWFALLLLVLDRAFNRWHLLTEDSNIGDKPELDLQWLWLAPPIFIVWTNSHGAFAAGLAIFGAYLGGRSLELLARRGRQAWPTVLHLAAVGLVTCLATLVNPYGYELLVWLAQSIAHPRPEITEWAAPKMSDPVFWPFVALVVVTAAAWLGTKHRRDWTQIAILSLVAWQSALHLRHIALLAILCGFWMPVHLQSALSRLRPSRTTRLPIVRLPSWMRVGVTAGLIASIGLIGFGAAKRLSSLPVYRHMYPVDAIQYMAEQQLRGRMVVVFNWAQYALAALAPNVQVSFDGRFDTCYPQEVADMNFDFLLGEFDGRRHRSPNSGPIDSAKVLEFGEPNLVLLDRKYKESVAVMEAEANRDKPEWVLLYQDAVAQLWGRSDWYDDPQSPYYFDPSRRMISDHLSYSYKAWPALPTGPEQLRKSPAQPTLAGSQ
jgi:hypothetical protein